MKIAICATIVAGLMTGSSPILAHEPPPKGSQFLTLASEPEPRLYVDQPLAEPLAQRGTAIIPYRTENLRILPIFGAAATAVSPRAGHLHVTVDDLPWHWADAGNTDAIVIAGLPAGRHKVLIEIATPDHHVIGGKTVEFDVPSITSNAHSGH
ncbi:MAG: hypothetical protein COA80_07260 [Leeuwenhoekiella sp.]|nr:MAG: hypothetical protein COA80_07260 [Leeuwenhoekiella sp.]